MKKIISLTIISLTLALMLALPALAETSLRVIRPEVRMTSEKGGGATVKVLQFAEEVILIRQEGDYCLVRDCVGFAGFVATGYLVANAKKVWLGNQVALSPKPGMTCWDFGFAAGGIRSNELALIIFDDEGGYYSFLVTEDGFSGYVFKYDPEVKVVISD